MTADATPVLYVVDDDPWVCDALQELGMSIGVSVRSFEDASSFLAAGAPPGPACLLIDVRLPGQGGLDLHRELHASMPHVPVIMITGHATVALAVDTLKEGAFDFIEKPFDEHRLLQAIYAGIAEARRRHADDARRRDLQTRLASLSPRERLTLDALIEGLSSKEIAHRENLSVRTVEKYRASLMAKMSVNTTGRLVAEISPLIDREEVPRGMGNSTPSTP